MLLLSVTKNTIHTGASSDVRLYKGPRVDQCVAWWTSTRHLLCQTSSEGRRDRMTGVRVGLGPQFSDVTLMFGRGDAAQGL